MRHSLVFRLTLVTAAIIGVSFAAWAVIVHRSTSVAFIETQTEIQTGINPGLSEARVKEALEEAFRISGWSGAREVADLQVSLPDGAAFLIVDSKLAVGAATSSPLFNAQVVEDEDGMLHVNLETREDGVAFQFEMSSAHSPTLLDAAGRPWGRLVMLPDPPSRSIGERFAAQVWRGAALWLIGVVLLAMLVMAFVLRRSLAPIDRLTSAARELQAGQMPDRIASARESEFKGLIDAFNAAIESIATTECIRTQLISDIAHELRTPVTNIKGQLEACDAGLIKPDDEFLGTLKGETRLLERLVEDFQQLAISDAGQVRLNLQSLPLAEVVTNILAPAAEAAGAALHVEAPGDVDVVADEERLRQILLNLMDNAARHRPSGLRIDVTAEVDAQSATLVFRDNGPGVAPVDEPYIFERFYRAEKSRNRATGGAGLGLTIVKGLVEAMGGSIRYVRDASPGAAFAITLPRPRREDRSAM